jgi:hypothetical protein
MSEFEYDVFLSHSASDKDTVRDIANRLKSDGVRVWFDEWAIKPGDSIPAKIEDGLEHSRVLVLCMSAAALASDWPQLESHTFRFKDPLNKDRRFIPLRLDAAEIKGSMAQLKHIDYRTPEREGSYAILLGACRNPDSWSENRKSVASPWERTGAPSRRWPIWALAAMVLLCPVIYVAVHVSAPGDSGNLPSKGIAKSPTSKEPPEQSVASGNGSITYHIRNLPGNGDRRDVVWKAWLAWQEVGPLTGKIAEREEDATVIIDVGKVKIVEALRPNEDGNDSGKWLVLFSDQKEFTDHELQGLTSYAFGRVLHFGNSDNPGDVMFDPVNQSTTRVLKPSPNDLQELQDRYSSE